MLFFCDFLKIKKKKFLFFSCVINYKNGMVLNLEHEKFFAISEKFYKKDKK